MADISQDELDDIYAFAVNLGKEAGSMLLDAAKLRIGDNRATQEQKEHVQKENAVDLVTETDEELEAFIRKAIAEKYPLHKFVGEESYSKGASRDYLIDDSPTWCIDPLDGTVNYIHLFPMFCISIAFIHKSKPLVGVINAPFLNQFFSSCSGRGAWLNESQQLPLIRNPIPPMPEKAPSGCVFSCEWGKDRRDIPDGNMHRKIESFVNMAAELGGRQGRGGMVHGVRSLGSATLDLAYVAMGSFDIWWEGGCWEWDVAAGIAILQEAGGLITTANPPPNEATAPIEAVKLGSRLYLAIRPAGPSSTETARETQERTVREVWRRVRNLDYSRPGA
ncbi:inositol monophosphatase [Aaosphaeria arxii CBS 175.79]|uniref:Inositol-1-monophosphatase n=1 Tax=Aaosphaeria arxii CBS 175.79 TaxID=1450172 RepID=A0A6A5Y2R2_9PLEO|nr:inositol monophosphatase [Aaosphaeria arxii CBS 175.79]KAF2019748.1 inositol monophosphatase [Aaosphaeria arxii CBS 175.79]